MDEYHIKVQNIFGKKTKNEQNEDDTFQLFI